MLTITSSAGAHLLGLLDGQDENSVVRIVNRSRRLKLCRGRVREGDRTFAHKGRVVLAVDDRMFSSLSTRKIDVRETDTGPKLRIQVGTT